MPRIDSTLPPTPLTDLVNLPFDEQVKAHFTDWDANHDNFISPTEVDQAVADPRYRGDAGAALATLKGKVGELAQLSNDEYGEENDGVSVWDLEAHRASIVDGSDDGETEGKYQSNRAKIDVASHELFSGEALDIDSLEQGARGDCWFLASAVSASRRDPENFQSQFKDNRDGTYTVHFEGMDPVLVDAPTDAEIAYGASSGADGNWGTVLEKAAGQVQWEARLYGGPTLPADEIDGGRTNSEGMAYFTGAETKYHWLGGMPAAKVRDQLEAGTQSNKLMVASSPESATAVVGDHAYTVLGYDRASDTVTLRNPWGHTEPVDANGATLDGQDDGVFTLSLQQFQSIFDGYTIQQ